MEVRRFAGFATGPFCSWPDGYPNPPYVISLVLECVIGKDILRNCQNPHIRSLTCSVRAVMAGKANCKPFYQKSKPKQYRILRWIAEFSAIIQDYKDARVGIPTTYQFSLPLWLEDRWVLGNDRGFL